MQNLRLKLGFVLILILVSFWLLYPTIRFYSMTPAARQELRKNEAEYERVMKSVIKLGLDLQGGIRLVYEIDKKDLKDTVDLRSALSQATEIIQNRLDQSGTHEAIVQKEGRDRVIVEIPGYEDIRAAQKLINQTARLEFKLLQDKDKLVEVLRSLDQYLVRKRSGGDSTADSMTATDTASLDTAAVDLFQDAASAVSPAADTAGRDTSATADSMAGILDAQRPFTSLLTGDVEQGGDKRADIYVRKKDIYKVKQLLAREDIVRLIPKASQFLWGAQEEPLRDGSVARTLYFIKSRPELVGDAIKDARATIEQGGMQSGQWIVELTMNAKGTKKFARVTENNVDKRLAIVLDNTVYSAPNIQEKIPYGRARITGMFGQEESGRLAVVLRTGALPASLIINSENLVGPTLGMDSILKGARAGIFGLILVILCMIIYYRVSGLIANMALILNVVFLLAVQTYVGLTLTLPGIAGIILTVGMAVDANVLIFERIREELRLGKTARTAVDAGYRRAFTTIFDSNVTSLITAIILDYFGSGPIKGFAKTLFIGLCISMFTSIWVTRIVFDMITAKSQDNKLSI